MEEEINKIIITNKIRALLEKMTRSDYYKIRERISI